MSEVVVVGAGLIGASIARRAAERGARVHVIEGSRPASGTSLATFSWVNAVGKQPRRYFDLNVAGMEEHRRLIGELGDGEWYHAGGNLEWSPGLDELRARADRHRDWGYRVEWLEPAQARALEPDISIDDGDGVAFYPDDAWVDPALLVRRLLETEGVSLSTRTSVQRIDSSAGRAHGVELADGRRIMADAVVIATGPRASDLLKPLGFDLPMIHARASLRSRSRPRSE